MSDIIAVVDDPYGSAIGVTVLIGHPDFVVSSSLTSVPAIENMVDVDLTTLINGSLLIYKATTSKWTSSITLNAQSIDGGEY